jgi:hypothetical protein
MAFSFGLITGISLILLLIFCALLFLSIKYPYAVLFPELHRKPRTMD